MPHPESLTSPLLLDLGFRHAFFTRRGGWSEGPFASLNFSETVGDDPARVERNLEAAAESLGVTPSRLYFCTQVHGAAVAVVGPEQSALELRALEADAVIVGEEGAAAAVRTADCIPILLGHVPSGRVAAVHAGWRGVQANIAAAAVGELRRAFGAGRVVAALGPHIRFAAFEVSEDVARQLEEASPVEGAVEWRGARPHVELARIARAQLVAAGLAVEDVQDVGGCTVTDAGAFFSYRRDGARTGRHLHAIVARPPL